jgi:myo-inositol catabolism protein IolC
MKYRGTAHALRMAQEDARRLDRAMSAALKSQRDHHLSIIKARIERIESRLCERAQTYSSSLPILRDLYREIAGEQG